MYVTRIHDGERLVLSKGDEEANLTVQEGDRVLVFQVAEGELMMLYLYLKQICILKGESEFLLKVIADIVIDIGNSAEQDIHMLPKPEREM